MFTAIFAHHKKAVARERQVLCATVPAANESLRVIETAIQQCQIAPAQPNAYLAQLSQDLDSAVAAILKPDTTHCNAACIWPFALAAVIARKKDRYARISPSAIRVPGYREALPYRQQWIIEPEADLLIQLQRTSPVISTIPSAQAATRYSRA